MEIPDTNAPLLAEIEKSDPLEEEAAAAKPPSRSKPNKVKIQELEEKLEEAIAGEDYETAARLRDEISRLTGD